MAEPKNTTTTEEKDESSPFYEDVENLKKLCDFLRSKHGPAIREALLMEKRVHYLKGKLTPIAFSSIKREGCINFFDFFTYKICCINTLGEKLVNFLVDPKKGTKWPSNLPKFENRVEAISTCKELIRNQFLIRSEKVAKGELNVSQKRMVEENELYK